MHPDFVRDRRAIKRMYDEFKVAINGLVAKHEKTPPEGWLTPDGSPWPGNDRGDHVGMIQVPTHTPLGPESEGVFTLKPQLYIRRTLTLDPRLFLVSAAPSDVSSVCTGFRCFCNQRGRQGTQRGTPSPSWSTFPARRGRGTTTTRRRGP